MRPWWLYAATMALCAGARALTVDGGLSNFQVLQANDSNAADVTLAGSATAGGAVQAQVAGPAGEVKPWADIAPINGGKWQGALTALPVGGPYTVSLRVLDSAGAPVEQAAVTDVLVGDLWILAGQSNMQGYANLVNTETEDPLVHAYAFSDQWKIAKDPLHVLEESHDVVHAAPPDDATRAQQIKDAYARTKGGGLGMTFAKELAKRTGRPIGLVPCAHGGTSMDQWNPAAKDQGGASLYGSMFRRFAAVGGRVKGVLWYQGEAEANPQLSAAFPDKFKAFIDAVRKDFSAPELPFIYVQLGRFVHADVEFKSWNTVQIAQLNISAELKNVAMASAVDLTLDDPIHIGIEGHKVLGARMANLAEALVYGGKVAPGPRVESVTRMVTQFGPTVRVKFTSPNGALQAKGAVSGFTISKGPDGDDTPAIYKQEIAADDLSTIVLWANELPENPHLWYGRGLDPHCNLSDAAGMGVPVFGPVAIPAQ